MYIKARVQTIVKMNLYRVITIKEIQLIREALFQSLEKAVEENDIKISNGWQNLYGIEVRKMEDIH